MNKLLRSLKVIGLAVALTWLTTFGVLRITGQGLPALGIALPEVVALFETSLNSSVSSSATSMTLQVGVDDAGNTLSGTYGFIIDEGTSSQEFILCTAAGTALTACSRGISVTDGKTSVAALQQSHRRGATVKITDWPIVGTFKRLLNGQESFPSRLSYFGHPSFSGVTASTSFVDRGYVDDLYTSVAGAANADTGTKGISEEATSAEINAGTGKGATLARLFMNPSQFASSSFGELRRVVNLSQAKGDIAMFGTNDYGTLAASVSYGSFLMSSGAAASVSYKFPTRLYVDASTTATDTTNAEFTIWTATVSANTFSQVGRSIDYTSYFSNFGINTASATATFKLKYGSTTIVTCAVAAMNAIPANTGVAGMIQGSLIATGANAQFGTFALLGTGRNTTMMQSDLNSSSNSRRSAACVSTGTGAETTATAKLITLTLQFSESNSNTGYSRAGNVVKFNY